MMGISGSPDYITISKRVNGIKVCYNEYKLESVIGDGAYEAKNNYKLAAKLDIPITATPQKKRLVRG